MIIIISPAKKIKTGSIKDVKSTEIDFQKESKELMKYIKELSPKDLSELMNISPNLAELNFERNMKWQYPFENEEKGHALLMFQGHAYQGMDAKTFSKQDFEFAQKHLRMLSGLYGILKPFDIILPYRLEMSTKLKTESSNNLYEFWGSKLSNKINEELAEQNKKILINLASNEYFKAVNTKFLKAKIITPVFKENKNGTYKNISVYAKKARGLMCRYIIKNKLKNYEDLKGFDYENYNFNHELSNENEYIFTR